LTNRYSCTKTYYDYDLESFEEYECKDEKTFDGFSIKAWPASSEDESIKSRFESR
jgi:hypothetical protein